MTHASRIPADQLTARFRSDGGCTCCDCTNRKLGEALDSFDDALVVDEGEEPAEVAMGLLAAFARANDLVDGDDKLYELWASLRVSLADELRRLEELERDATPEERVAQAASDDDADAGGEP